MNTEPFHINNHVLRDGQRGRVTEVKQRLKYGDYIVRVLWDGWAHGTWVHADELTLDTSLFDSAREILGG